MALFPVRVDNLQQGAAFHFTKYAAFFEKWIRLRTRLWRTRRKQKYTEADVFLLSPAPIYPYREQCDIGSGCKSQKLWTAASFIKDSIFSVFFNRFPLFVF